MTKEEKFKELDIVDVYNEKGDIIINGIYVSHLENKNGDYCLSDGCFFITANEKNLKLTKNK
jgi:hypothetical protein